MKFQIWGGGRRGSRIGQSSSILPTPVFDGCDAAALVQPRGLDLRRRGEAEQPQLGADVEHQHERIEPGGGLRRFGVCRGMVREGGGVRRCPRTCVRGRDIPWRDSCFCVCPISLFRTFPRLRRTLARFWRMNSEWSTCFLNSLLARCTCIRGGKAGEERSPSILGRMHVRAPCAAGRVSRPPGPSDGRPWVRRRCPTADR